MGRGWSDKVRTVLATSWNINCIGTTGRDGGDEWLLPINSWGAASQFCALARKSLAML